MAFLPLREFLRCVDAHKCLYAIVEITACPPTWQKIITCRRVVANKLSTGAQRQINQRDRYDRALHHEPKPRVRYTLCC